MNIVDNSGYGNNKGNRLEHINNKRRASGTNVVWCVMIMMADKLIGTPEGETNPTEEEKA